MFRTSLPFLIADRPALFLLVFDAAPFQPGKHYPISVWGPIILGTIAGCGGLFLPLDKGLKASYYE